MKSKDTLLTQLKRSCRRHAATDSHISLEVPCHSQDWGYVTIALVLVCAFHVVYMWDAMWKDKAMLTTMEITTDGPGSMLT